MYWLMEIPHGVSYMGTEGSPGTEEPPRLSALQDNNNCEVSLVQRYTIDKFIHNYANVPT